MKYLFDFLKDTLLTITAITIIFYIIFSVGVAILWPLLALILL